MREANKPSANQGEEPTREQRWPMQDFWPFVIKRIGIVGAAAPLLLFIEELIPWGQSLLFPKGCFVASLKGPVDAVAVGVFGFILAIAAAAIVAYLADLFLRHLNFAYETLVVGGLVGGAVGLLAMIFLVPIASADELNFSIALNMIVATAIGQIGGAWGAWDSQVVRRASSKTEPSFAEQSERNPTFQFSIRQLLVMTTCCALLLTVLKLLGILTVSLLYYFGIWVAVQLIGGLVIKNVDNTLQRRLLDVCEQRE